MRVGRIRPVEIGVGCQSRGVVDLHDAEAEQLERHGDQRRLQVRLRQGWDDRRDETGGGFEQDPFRLPIVLPSDDPARRVGRVARHPSCVEPCVAHEEGVVVVRPQCAASSRGDRLEIVGRRPAAPAVDVPAMSLEPRSRIIEGHMSSPHLLEAVGERRRTGQVDLAGRRRQARKVQVGVGQARDGDLVRLEGDPLGERVGTGLQVDLGAGECDATVADPDRLDPAEPVLTGQRGDPTGDQAVERHVVRVVGRRGGQPARRDRGRHRARARARPGP